MEEIPSGPENLDGRGWRDLGIGLLLAILALSFPLVDGILSALLTVFHELGHTVCGWIFGFPGLPAFDLKYGGGVTTMQARSPLILAVVVLGLLWCATQLWRNPRGRGVVILALGGYLLASITRLHRMLISMAGHGGELVLGGIFLYRGATGRAVLREEERPLFATVAWYTILRGVLLAWGLIRDPVARARYGAAKGGGHWMDFSRLAERDLGVPLEWVAGAFLVACLATPLVVWGIHRYRQDLGEWWREALRLEEAG